MRRPSRTQWGPALARPRRSLDQPVEGRDLALGQAVLDPRDPRPAGVLVGRTHALDDERHAAARRLVADPVVDRLAQLGCFDGRLELARVGALDGDPDVTVGA